MKRAAPRSIARPRAPAQKLARAERHHRARRSYARHVERKRPIADLKESIDLGAQLLAQRRTDDIARDITFADQHLAHAMARSRRQALAETALRRRIEEAVLDEDLTENGDACIRFDRDHLAAREVRPGARDPRCGPAFRAGGRAPSPAREAASRGRRRASFPRVAPGSARSND